MIVQLNKVSSSPSDLDLGIIQGSLLGPFSFVLFANDLSHNISNGKVVLFADDTCILLSAYDQLSLQNETKVILKEFEQWINKNRLLLNSDNTVFINYFNRKLISASLSFTIVQANITTSDDILVKN